MLLSCALAAAAAPRPPVSPRSNAHAVPVPAGWQIASLPRLAPAQAVLLREFHLRWRRAWLPSSSASAAVHSPRLILERFRGASGAFGAYSCQRAFAEPRAGFARAIPRLNRAWQSPRQWTLLRGRNVVLLRGAWPAHQFQSALRWAAALPRGDAARDIAPDLPLHLPAPARVAGSLRYGYGPAALASAAPWFPVQAANFPDDPEFAAALYARPRGIAHLLLWSYPTPQIAHAQLQTFRRMWSAHPHVFVRRSGTWLIVVRSSDPSLAHSLLARIHQRVHITWSRIGPSQVILAAELLLSILVFVALLMGASIVVGILSGWLRRQLAHWFPRHFHSVVKSFIWLELNEYESKSPSSPDTK